MDSLLFIGIVKNVVLGPDDPLPVETGVCLNIEYDCSSVDPLSPFAPLSGACNNLAPGRTGWGAIGQPFERLLPADYADGKTRNQPSLRLVRQLFSFWPNVFLRNFGYP